MRFPFVVRRTHKRYCTFHTRDARELLGRTAIWRLESRQNQLQSKVAVTLDCGGTTPLLLRA